MSGDDPKEELRLDCRSLTGTMELHQRFREVPHSCSDPSCPGNQNRKRLAAARKMADALRNIQAARKRQLEAPGQYPEDDHVAMTTMAAEIDELAESALREWREAQA